MRVPPSGLILHNVLGSHATFQWFSLRFVIPHPASGSHTTFQGYTLRFVIWHHVSGSRVTFQGSFLHLVIQHYVSWIHIKFLLSTCKLAYPPVQLRYVIIYLLHSHCKCDYYINLSFWKLQFCKKILWGYAKTEILVLWSHYVVWRIFLVPPHNVF